MTMTHTSTPHHESPDTVGRRDRMGVMLLIFADLAFVLSLVFTWFYLRTQNTNNHWIPDDVTTASQSEGWTVTGVAIVSSALAYLGLRAIRKNSQSQLLGFFTLAFVTIVLDLVLQLRALQHFPFHMSNGTYASTMIALAGANVFHLALTCFLGLGMVNRIRQHRYSSEDHFHVLIVTYWWIWVSTAAVITSLTTMATHA
ncbi:MAG: hypothetical protein WCO64_07780 [Actinomycetes bacterium]